MNRLSRMDLAYLAGFFDGEGSIHLRRAHGAGHRPLRTYSLVVDVACGTHHSAMVRTAQMVGKRPELKALPAINGTGNKRVAGRVRLHTAEALEFLIAIQPYRHVKAEQPQIAIDFQRAKPGRGKRCSAEREAAEQRTKDALTALNRRGVSGS